MLDRRGPNGGPNGGGNGSAGGGPNAEARPRGEGWRRDLTDAERTEVEEFFKSKSPKRYEKYDQLSDERKQKLLEAVGGQYRMLQRLQKDDPEMYQVRVSRLPIEDEMFALAWEL